MDRLLYEEGSRDEGLLVTTVQTISCLWRRSCSGRWTFMIWILYRKGGGSMISPSLKEIVMMKSFHLTSTSGIVNVMEGLLAGLHTNWIKGTKHRSKFFRLVWIISFQFTLILFSAFLWNVVFLHRHLPLRTFSNKEGVGHLLFPKNGEDICSSPKGGKDICHSPPPNKIVTAFAPYPNLYYLVDLIIVSIFTTTTTVLSRCTSAHVRCESVAERK